MATIADFSEETRSRFITRMNDLSPMNFEKAELVASEFGVKVKAVIASATRNGIAYDRKARVNKAGVPVASKADLVVAIAEKFGKDVEALSGLDKATKSALEALLE